MDFRVGTCTQCKAQYRVPATFTSDKAKCKSCSGVVEIGPVQSSEAKGVASKPAPAAGRPASAPAPSKPAPIPGRVAPAAPPAASSAAKPVPAKAPPVRPVPPPAAAKAPLAAKPNVPAPLKPAAHAKQPVPAAAARSGAKGAESVRSAAEAAAGKVRREGAKSGSTTRARKAQKKPSPVLAGLSLVAIVIIGGGVGWYFWDKNNKKLAAEDAPPASTVQAAKEQPAATAPQEPASSEVASAPTPPAAATPETPKEPTPPPAPAPEKPLVDDIVLMDLPMQAPLEGTTPEQIEEMEAWVELVLDLDSGARGSRALKSLEERSKAAFPFVLNGMRRLDLATNDGMQNGGRLQRLLQDICHGTNFGWKFTTEPKDVIYNKKVVKKWFTNWEAARDDDAVWAKMAKLNQPKEDPPVDDPADQ